MWHSDHRANITRLRVAVILAAVIFWLLWPLAGTGFSAVVAVVVGLTAIALLEDIMRLFLH